MTLLVICRHIIVTIWHIIKNCNVFLTDEVTQLNCFTFLQKCQTRSNTARDFFAKRSKLSLKLVEYRFLEEGF